MKQLNEVLAVVGDLRASRETQTQQTTDVAKREMIRPLD